MTTVSYILTIHGTTWEGIKGELEHRLTYHPTQADIRELSGDFQHVDSIELDRYTQTTEWEAVKPKEV